MKSFFSFAFVFFIASHVLAAACCGGGANFPLLITGDFKAQFATSMSFAEVIGDVDTLGNSVFRAEGNDETINRFQMEAALQVSELWQIGLTVPWDYRSRSIGQVESYDSGLADISVQASFEFLPERTFSYWKPRGFIFTRWTFPIAPSIYDSTDTLATDARGQGFLVSSLGVMFVKNIFNWDFQFMSEVHRNFANSFESSSGASVDVDGSFGASMLMSAGYSWNKLRFGVGLSPRVEGARDVTSNSSISSTSKQQVWDTNFALSYLYETEWLGILSYNDQTLWGPAENTNLTRSVAVSIQRRWPL